ncbi:uncharacterized protein [Clytia hemisphaerica]|uniref:uncharacterized protein n=1 Tax=Clytia hemisphaerica TaxID=252671 RepID=UPI0034D703AE
MNIFCMKDRGEKWFILIRRKDSKCNDSVSRITDNTMSTNLIQNYNHNTTLYYLSNSLVYNCSIPYNIFNCSIINNRTTLNYSSNDKESCMSLNTFAPIIPIAVVISIFGHCIILRTLKKHESLHQPYFIFIANHSIADMIFLFSGALLTVYDRISGHNVNEYINMALLVIIRSCLLQTMLTTIYLSINRYLTIRLPLTYQNIISRKRTYLLIAVTWFSMTVVLSATVEHGKKSFSNRPYHNLFTVILAWLTHSVELPVIYYTQREGQRIIAEIQQTTSQLHGDEAEQLTVIKERRKRNKQVGYLLMFNQALLIPYNVGFSVLLVVQLSLADWQCFNFLFSFYACASSALHPVVFIGTLSELRGIIKRDLKRILNRGRVNIL